MSLTDSFLGVSLLHEPDHAGASVLHLGVLDLAAVGEPLAEDLPVAVWGQVAHDHGVGGGSGHSTASERLGFDAAVRVLLHAGHA